MFFKDDPVKIVKVVLEKSGLKFKFLSTGPTTEYRYKTMFTKEPETIVWFRNLREDDIAWDIGANIGIYSIFGGLKTGAKIFCFEPEAANFAVLNKNIFLNNLDKRLTAYCVGLSDKDQLSNLYLRSLNSGSAINSLNEPVDDSGNEFDPVARQGSLSLRIDTLVEKFGLPQPTAVKIDVDGHELPLLDGAQKTFSSEKLTRLTIELDNSDEKKVNFVHKYFEEKGYRLVSSKRYSKEFKGSMISNHQFVRG